MDAARLYLEDVIDQFEKLKKHAEAAVAQVSDEELFRCLDGESNSIGILMRHIGGNLRSRFTDFLTSDGEKPDRARDSEFETPEASSRETVIALWDLGFRELLDNLRGLTESDLTRDVFIRGQRHSVIQAINRSLTHVAGHIGQIVLLAKHARGAAWRTLSIPRGQSAAFNAQLRP